MKTIYERTNTKLHEVIAYMVCTPKYIEIHKKDTKRKYNFKLNKQWLIEHYIRDVQFVKDMHYNEHTKILSITLR